MSAASVLCCADCPAYGLLRSARRRAYAKQVVWAHSAAPVHVQQLQHPSHSRLFVTTAGLVNHLPLSREGVCRGEVCHAPGPLCTSTSQGQGSVACVSAPCCHVCLQCGRPGFQGPDSELEHKHHQAVPVPWSNDGEHVSAPCAAWSAEVLACRQCLWS